MNTNGSSKAVAIIGMACRFPGANNITTFWDNLCRGLESITHFSREDLLREGVDATLLDDPNYVRASPILEGFDLFDAAFFGYSAREAQFMDPQQRLLHEVAWEAFEDAGYYPETAEGPTGVFASAGGVVTSYLVAHQSRHSSLPGSTGSMQHIGNDKDFLSTRLSYKLNLTGPSLNIQTACSSSLVALHQACRSIASGECRMALVGAASVRIPHKTGYFYKKGDILSPDGHCRAFDARAEGTVFGSGVAAVLLKSLDDAKADRDQVYAVIKGTAINNDGAQKVSYTASSVPAQSRAMVEALALSGVPPETISYVECHGTGTTVGDPLEVQALNRAFRVFTSRVGFCAIGSVKTNIGHLEQTAGLAGLIKVALAIRNSQIPPSLNYESPNPKIAFGEGPFFVNTKLSVWEGIGGRCRAAVNALGLGGTNAFAILEAAPNEAPPETADSERPLQILSLSAKDDSALEELASRIKDRLAVDLKLDLADVCFTAAASRSQMPTRVAVVARTREEMVERLRPVAESSDGPGLARGTGKRKPLAFLFSGQGSQYFGMSAQFYRALPQFRRILDRCDEMFRPHLERKLLDVIFAEDGDGGRLHETAYTQPALFAVEYALAKLWQSFGVVPDAVMGHSVGEFAAACVAGAMSLEDASKLIAGRARLMQGLPPGGSMAAVLADEETVVHLMAAHGERLSIAAVNAPDSVVVSGTANAVRAFLKSLEAEKIVAKQLVVSHAFHSTLMEPILDELELVAQQAEFKTPAIPMVSNLTGLLADEAPTGLYWKQHARGVVQFAKGMETLAKLGCTTFLEIGPGNTLLALGRQSVPRVKGVWLASLRRHGDEIEGFFDTLCRLYVEGHAINWKAIETANSGRRVSLPTYPFRRQSYLLEDNVPVTRPAAKVTSGSHLLLGRRLRSGLKEAQFEATYGLAQFPFLDDHRIYGLPVLPTTAGLEVAMAGGMSLFASREIELKNFVYHEALLLPEEGIRIVHAIFSPERQGTLLFQILSTDASDNSPWSSHISGTLAARGPSSGPDKSFSIQDLVARQTREIPVDLYYQAIARLGLNYGPSFRGIQALWCGEGEALSRVQIAKSLAIEHFELHPAFLDACLHIYPALIKEYGDFTTLPDKLRQTFLPISLERVRFLARGLKEAWVHAVRRPAPGESPNTVTIDLRVLDAEGQEVASLTGLALKRLAPEDLRPAQADKIESWLYQMRWVPCPSLAPALSDRGSPSRWLVFADQQGVAVELAKLLEGLDQKCQMVYPDQALAGDGGERIIDAVIDAALTEHQYYRGVIYLWGLDHVQMSETTPDLLVRSERLIVGGALALIRALSRASQCFPQMPRLWLVTRNSQPAISDSPPVEPLPAMLWGLGRTAAFEHPKIWGGLVDLEGLDGCSTRIQSDAEALLLEIWNPDEEKQIAIRPTGRLAARFVRLPQGIGNQGQLFREDATYLITGGLGSLGLKVAEWMVARGARGLVLTSRRGAQGKAAETVRGLEAKGVRSLVAIGDITDEAELNRILGEVRANMPPLRGVFHCAGMLNDGILDQMDWDRFSAVTAPKVKGSWLLHRATLNDELDHFVLFSSILSLMGSQGQSNYTAANAFLDALTEHRRAAGLPAVTLNWGPWAETGLATVSGHRGEAIWKSRGTRYIPPHRGIEVLEHILRRGVGHAAVTITDWREFLQQFPTPIPFYEDLAKGAGPWRKGRETGRDPRATRALVDAAKDGERRKLTVEIVGQEVAELLGLGDSIDPERPLSELGLDSLMSVNLVNKLEPAFGVLVPMASLLKGPSVEELVDSIFPNLAGMSPREVEKSNASTGGMRSTIVPRSDWLVVTKPNSAATVRLFCFPFAGGGSAVYRLWNDTIGPSIEVIAVEPPGRLARVDQAPVNDVDVFTAQAAKAMIPLLDKPYAMFGHCLGGLTMYETARQLQRAGEKLPIHMFACGARPPDLIDKEGPFERLLQDRLLTNRLYDPFLPIHEQPEEVFADVIRLFRIDSTEQMLKSPELRAMVLPVVRAEFEMAFNYRYRQEKPWNFPITCFNGENDLYVTRTDILAWSRLTTASFQVHIRQGEHFLLVDDRDFLMGTIARELTDRNGSRSFDRPSNNSRSQAQADTAGSGLNVRANSHPHR